MRIINTLPEFRHYWESLKDSSPEKIIDVWKNQYMAQWPWLLKKQMDDYKSQGEDWREVALHRIFPRLSEDSGCFDTVNEMLLAEIPEIHKQALEVFSLSDFHICYVTYVGIGCGAGWVKDVSGGQGVLFGLEMIAKCGWTDRESIRGLIAHEIGHAVHGKLRGDPFLDSQCGPWWRLYIEGFAQICEQMLTGSQSWHEGTGLNPPDWISWCETNRGILAEKFINESHSDTQWRKLFGSWYQFRGYRQCGYHLGTMALRELDQMKIEEIAMIDKPERVLKPVLESFIPGS